MKQCSANGCLSRVVCKGMCRKHYVRLRKHGDVAVVAKRGPFKKIRVRCVVAGCEKLGGRNTNGMCCAHNARLKRHGNPLAGRETFQTKEQEIAAKTDRSGGPDACWPWTGTVNNTGYGVMSISATRKALAHRFVVELSLGRKLAREECACHCCDNPPCCNPAHLFVGSHTDNMRDMFAKNRRDHAKGEQIGLHKLTEAQVIALRKAPGTNRELAAAFNIDKSNVSRIKNRIRWKHI